jgi:RES domain-containing protein
MQVWRICKKQYSEGAFSGQGGLNSDGRWHRKGHLIVYTAQSRSLAAIEQWVHMRPEDPLYFIHEADLPLGWNQKPAPAFVRDIGMRWLTSRLSAVARVPAATTPGEFNYLLNPAHKDFARITQGSPQPFTFDPRMLKRVDVSPEKL